MANGLPPGPGVPAQQLPPWLGSAVQLTTQVGVPTLFAGVLLWFVLTRVGGTLESIEEKDAARTQLIAAAEQSLVNTMNVQTERLEKAMRDNLAVGEEIVRALESLQREQRERPAPQEGH